jgi:hypothetical protein
MLTYGSEALNECKRDESTVIGLQIKYVRRKANCTGLDYKRYLDIMKEFNTQIIMEFMENYRYPLEKPYPLNDPLRNHIPNFP